MTRLTSHLKHVMLAMGALLILTVSHAEAIDWVMPDGTTYENVSVVKVEADAVTIIHRNGGALVPLEKLPVYLQVKFHYDPVKAKIAAEIRARQDAQDAKALQAEMDLAAKKKNAQFVTDAKAEAKAKAAVAH